MVNKNVPMVFSHCRLYSNKQMSRYRKIAFWKLVREVQIFAYRIVMASHHLRNPNIPSAQNKTIVKHDLQRTKRFHINRNRQRMDRIELQGRLTTLGSVKYSGEGIRASVKKRAKIRGLLVGVKNIVF